MAKEVLHVVPHDQVWAVRREGNERVSSTHPTQKDAIEAARELAKERDDIVIHRPDGTIRERVTYIGSQENGERQNGERRAAAEVVGPEDLAAVGTRVRWEAVVAGAAVALAAFFVLSLLALAIGLSVGDRADRTTGIVAAVLSAAILFVSLFYGGYVASRVTAGERPGEGVIYGVLVWATTLLFIAAGARFGYPVAAGWTGPSSPTVSADRVKRELGLTDQQAERYATLTQNPRGFVAETDPQSAAWWTFAGVVLSLASAMAGGWFGTGAEVFVRREPYPAVEPRPA